MSNNQRVISIYHFWKSRAASWVYNSPWLVMFFTPKWNLGSPLDFGWMLGHPNPKTTPKKNEIKPYNSQKIRHGWLFHSLFSRLLWGSRSRFSRLSITRSTRARQRPRKSPGWKCRRCHLPGHKPPGSGRLHPVRRVVFFGDSLEELLEIYIWKNVGKKSLISSNIKHRTVFFKLWINDVLLEQHNYQGSVGSVFMSFMIIDPAQEVGYPS
jgi:hypothetical protein